jgi:uncharacterized protein YabN with tetrapyrrole methylase and pyrophosphatase domain
MPRSSSIHDIYIVGLGIMSSLQVTRETEQTLRLCKKVFYLHTEPKWIHDYLRDLSPEVVDIHRYYNEDTPREEAYIGMVQAVLEAAIQSPPVALALYGHPVVFVTPTQSILEVAPKHGLKVKVLPGISAFDCMGRPEPRDPNIRGQRHAAFQAQTAARPALFHLAGRGGRVRGLQQSDEQTESVHAAKAVPTPLLPSGA